MSYEELHEFIVSKFDVERSFPYGEKLAVYRIDDDNFLMIHVGSNPLKVDMRCDRKLAKLLRDKYESVMAASKLNPAKWNTVICSGQLSDDEVKDLAIHAYYEVAGYDQLPVID